MLELKGLILSCLQNKGNKSNVALTEDIDKAIQGYLCSNCPEGRCLI